jgi:glutamine synthetase
LEQEFTLFNLDEKTPLGWPEGGMPSRPQGPYYCSVGPENNFGRAITDAMYKAALYAGIAISGVNGEVMPGQQEYQGKNYDHAFDHAYVSMCAPRDVIRIKTHLVGKLLLPHLFVYISKVGPCVGIDAGDQLMMSRYILARVCEDFQVYCTLHPKPIVQGDWNGAGMHTNVSTKKMREEGGLEVIKQAIYKLGQKHSEHIAVYGEGNELRLTGKHETASIEKFSYGVANRGASVRIGRDTMAEGEGNFITRSTCTSRLHFRMLLCNQTFVHSPS